MARSLRTLGLMAILLVLAPSFVAGQGFIDPFQATGVSGGYQDLDIRIGTNDLVAVSFNDGSDVFVLTSLGGFGNELNISQSAVTSSGAALASGSTFLLYLAYQEETPVVGQTGSEILLRNNNGGVFGPADFVTSNDGIDDTNPVVQVNDLGDLDLVWQRQDGVLDPEVVIRRNQGTTLVVGLGTDPKIVKLGGGSVYVSYARGGMLFGRTFDGTAFGAEETLVSLAGTNEQLDISVDSAGAVHGVFTNAQEVYYVRRNDDGSIITPEFRDAGPVTDPPHISSNQAGHAGVVFAKNGQVQLHELSINSIWTMTNLTPFASGAGNPVIAMDSLDYSHIAFTLFGAVFYMNNVPAPIPDFAASSPGGQLPVTVEFSNLTTGVVTSYLWDFGDGETSTLPNPAHTYVTPGSFTVSLTATGPGGSVTETKTNLISTSLPANVLKVPFIPVFAGQADILHPIFATHTEPFQGFQLSMSYDGDLMPISELSFDSSFTEALNPEFVDIEFVGSGPNSGIVAGIIFDTESRFDFRTLDPGTNQLIAALRYDVPATAPVGTTTDLAFTDGLGTPPKNNVFSPSLGPSIFPYPLQGGYEVISDTQPGNLFRRGDVNFNVSIDISDAITLLTHLFNNGPVPPCRDAADANDDGSINIGDAIYVLAYLFSNGSTPPYPFPNPGLDPTPDSLDCAG